MQCTAHTRTGEQCKAPAIKGKDKCRMHGGSTPVKTGQYSKYKDLYFGERIAELQANPEELYDLGRQIAIITAVQEKFLTDLKATGTVGLKEGDYLMKLSESIAKNIERLKKLERDAELPAAMNQLIQVVINTANYAITNTDDKQRFIESIGQVSLPPAGRPEVQ